MPPIRLGSKEEIMKRLSILIMAMLLSACATEAKYQRILDTWTGSDELDLIRSWGAPQQSYEAKGHKFLVYSNDRNIVLPGSSPTYQTNVYGTTAYTTSYGGSPAMNLNMSCTTTFEVVDGKIYSWSYRGNDCTAQ